MALEDDTHFLRLKRPQLEELEDLVKLLDSGLVKRWGTAVDGGAHIGGWSAVLSPRFERVFAFEPAPDTYGLLAANMARLPNVVASQRALMDRRCRVAMIDDGKHRALTARYAQVRAIDTNADAIALDDLALNACDFIKLDLEGAEVLALRGAAKTIRQHRPFVVIEEFGHGHRYGHKAGAAAATLAAMGYVKVWDAGPNLGFGWRS